MMAAAALRMTNASVLLVYDDDSTLIVDEDFYQVGKSLFQLHTI